MHGTCVHLREERLIRAILLDIEGTTSPIEFVYRTLFPYARARLASFLEDQAGDSEVRAALGSLREEYKIEPTADHLELPDTVAAAVAYLEWLMDQDRKSTGLKAIQGLIWKGGFERGELKGQMFEDVAPALKRWRREGVQVAIFSSGSVLAQKQLFSHTENGDLTPFLSGYFDTETGPKRVAGSYQVIAQRMGFQPGEVLFISDIPEELAAAWEAGMSVKLAMRPGNKPVTAEATSGFDTILDFEGL